MVTTKLVKPVPAPIATAQKSMASEAGFEIHGGFKIVSLLRACRQILYRAKSGPRLVLRLDREEEMFQTAARQT